MKHPSLLFSRVLTCTRHEGLLKELSIQHNLSKPLFVAAAYVFHLCAIDDMAQLANILKCQLVVRIIVLRACGAPIVPFSAMRKPPRLDAV
jgi:hypothetical protein